MLMDHPDATRDRIVRRGNLAGGPVDQDLAAVRPVEAIGDAHRGRFPRAVLADQGVNRARPDQDVHPVVGQHVPEPFGDVAEFEHYGKRSEADR